MLTEAPQREMHEPRAAAPDQDQYTPPSREPINGETAPPAPQDVVMTAQEIEEVSEEQKIADMVKSVVIHPHKPMENLPDLPLPELKVIGRCIIFKGETLINGATQIMFYEGLVSTINKDTVSLIHVHRYTEEDFNVHYASEVDAIRKEAEETEAKEKAKQKQVQGSAPPNSDDQAVFNGEHNHSRPSTPTDVQANAATPGGASTGFAAPADHMGTEHNAAYDGLFVVANSTPAEGKQDESNQKSGEHQETTQRIRNRLRNNTGSMGPIPFMTFSRAHIHEVQFGRDPRSDFYSLFQDPTKEFFDMQCLRMFCRRYIIHTAQGNNPRLIPLRAFVTCRCNCPNLDNKLLEDVTLQEVGHLIKIAKDFKRTRRLSAVGNRHARAHLYEAPPGAFQNTGILYKFQVPQRLFIFGVVLVALAVVTAVLFGVIQMNMDPNVMWYYGRTFLAYVVASVLVWAFTGILIVGLSTRIHIPVVFCTIRLAPFLLLLLGTLGCGVMCVVVTAQGISTDHLGTFLVTTKKPIALVTYYQKHDCTGFTESCDANPITALNCKDIGTPTGKGPCFGAMMSQVQKLLIPIMVTSVVAAVVSFFTIVTLHKAVRVTNHVSADRASAPARRRSSAVT